LADNEKAEPRASWLRAARWDSAPYRGKKFSAPSKVIAGIEPA